ncbi:MAG TPA: CPBP family intramembrane glutamic endopeptidase [Thermoanaerobaculia bacterium]|nr:CPBP family intramembrane glutamic endopeptidase [Thermoanaerobaculia bacterium]
MEPGRLYRFAWGLYLFLAVAGAIWIGFQRGVIPLSLFLDTRHWWLDLGLGLGAGLLLLGLWAAAERIFPLARDLEAKLAQALGPLSGSESLALALLSGFAEELFFRGAVQGTLGLVGATLLFGLLHSGPGKELRLWTVFALLAGGVLGLLMVWRGNLLGPVAGHFLVNAVNLRRLAGQARDSAKLAPSETQSDKEI